MSLYIRPENFIDDLLSVIDSLTAEFVHKGFVSLIEFGKEGGLFASVLALYMVYFLYKAQFEQLPYSDCVKHLLKVLFVFMLSTSWDMFYLLVYRIFTDYPRQISTVLIEAIHSSDGSSSEATLSKMFGSGMSEAWSIFGQISYSPSSIVLCMIGGLLVFFGTIFFTVVALGITIISKIVLALYLVLAPYYLMMYLFDGTRGLSESWVKHTLGSALVPMFLNVTLAFVLIIGELSMSNIQGTSTAFHAIGEVGSTFKGAPSFSGITVYFVCSLCSIGIIYLSTSMAASLTSSLTQSALGGGRVAAAGALATRSKFQKIQQNRAGNQASKQANKVKNSKAREAVSKRANERARSAAIKQATMNQQRRLG